MARKTLKAELAELRQLLKDLQTPWKIYYHMPDGTLFGDPNEKYRFSDTGSN